MAPSEGVSWRLSSEDLRPLMAVAGWDPARANPKDSLLLGNLSGKVTQQVQGWQVELAPWLLEARVTRPEGLRKVFLKSAGGLLDGHAGITNTLLEHGANVNAAGEQGATALMMA